MGRLDESFEFPRRRTDGLFDELMSYRMKNWNFSFFFFFFFIKVIDNSERQSLFLSKKVILRIRASCNSLCEEMEKIGGRKKLARVLIGTKLGKIRNAGRSEITFPHVVRIINIHS